MRHNYMEIVTWGCIPGREPGELYKLKERKAVIPGGGWPVTEPAQGGCRPGKQTGHRVDAPGLTVVGEVNPGLTLPPGRGDPAAGGGGIP